MFLRIRLESLRTGLGPIKNPHKISEYVLAYTDTIADDAAGTAALLAEFDAAVPASIHHHQTRGSIPPEKLTPAQFGVSGSYMDNRMKVRDWHETREQRRARQEKAAAAEKDAILAAIHADS